MYPFAAYTAYLSHLRNRASPIQRCIQRWGQISADGQSQNYVWPLKSVFRMPWIEIGGIKLSVHQGSAGACTWNIRYGLSKSNLGCQCHIKECHKIPSNACKVPRTEVPWYIACRLCWCGCDLKLWNLALSSSRLRRSCSKTNSLFFLSTSARCSWKRSKVIQAAAPKGCSEYLTTYDYLLFMTSATSSQISNSVAMPNRPGIGHLSFSLAQGQIRKSDCI